MQFLHFFCIVVVSNGFEFELTSKRRKEILFYALSPFFMTLWKKGLVQKYMPMEFMTNCNVALCQWIMTRNKNKTENPDFSFAFLALKNSISANLFSFAITFIVVSKNCQYNTLLMAYNLDKGQEMSKNSTRFLENKCTWKEKHGSKPAKIRAFLIRIIFSNQSDKNVIHIYWRHHWNYGWVWR